MQADAQEEFVVWSVLDLEVAHFVEQAERGVSHLCRVAGSIAMGKTADQHVGVADCLHLSIGQSGYYC